MYVIVWRDFILVNMIFLFCEQCVDTRNKTNSVMNSKCPIKFPRTLICQNILKGTYIIDKKKLPFFHNFQYFYPLYFAFGYREPLHNASDGFWKKQCYAKLALHMWCVNYTAVPRHKCQLFESINPNLTALRSMRLILWTSHM